MFDFSISESRKKAREFSARLEERFLGIGEDRVLKKTDCDYILEDIGSSFDREFAGLNFDCLAYEELFALLLKHDVVLDSGGDFFDKIANGSIEKLEVDLSQEYSRMICLRYIAESLQDRGFEVDEEEYEEVYAESSGYFSSAVCDFFVGIEDGAVLKKMFKVFGQDCFDCEEVVDYIFTIARGSNKEEARFLCDKAREFIGMLEPAIAKKLLCTGDCGFFAVAAAAEKDELLEYFSSFFEKDELQALTTLNRDKFLEGAVSGNGEGLKWLFDKAENKDDKMEMAKSLLMVCAKNRSSGSASPFRIHAMLERFFAENFSSEERLAIVDDCGQEVFKVSVQEGSVDVLDWLDDQFRKMPNSVEMEEFVKSCFLDDRTGWFKHGTNLKAADWFELSSSVDLIKRFGKREEVASFGAKDGKKRVGDISVSKLEADSRKDPSPEFAGREAASFVSGKGRKMR